MLVTNPIVTDLTNTMCSVALPKHSFIWSLGGLQGLVFTKCENVTTPEEKLARPW